MEEGVFEQFDPEKLIPVAKGIYLRGWINEGILEKLGISVLKINFCLETPYHYHKKTQELFRFHNHGRIILEEEEFEVDKDTMLYIPAGKKHKLIPKETGLNSKLETTLITVPKFDPSDEYIA